jgi:hypothetical protein
VVKFLLEPFSTEENKNDARYSGSNHIIAGLLETQNVIEELAAVRIMLEPELNRCTLSRRSRKKVIEWLPA